MNIYALFPLVTTIAYIPLLITTISNRPWQKQHTLFVLFLIPDRIISTYLGSDNRFMAIVLAALIGSVTLMPGFIVYPLCGILLQKGVLYMVLSAFTTTLMMVGVLTYPIEKTYFGTKVTIIRNTLSFLIALIVAVITGIFFGEVFQ